MALESCFGFQRASDPAAVATCTTVIDMLHLKLIRFGRGLLTEPRGRVLQASLETLLIALLHSASKRCRLNAWLFRRH
jgi:hypothetical protein